MIIKFENFSTGYCDRCGEYSKSHHMSIFNIDDICQRCKLHEESDFEYLAAKYEDLINTHLGNYNYPGAIVNYTPIKYSK